MSKSKSMSDARFHILEIEKEAEVFEIRTAVRKMRHLELRQRFTRSIVQSWPLGVGLVLACFTPLLRDLAAIFDPWGAWILLPLASLLNCQQLHLAPGIRTMAEPWALYGQFPLEAIVIRFALKGRVSLGAVITQGVISHFLAAVFLWLLDASGAR
jgi:hypothetical protein